MEENKEFMEQETKDHTVNEAETPAVQTQDEAPAPEMTSGSTATDAAPETPVQGSTATDAAPETSAQVSATTDAAPETPVQGSAVTTENPALTGQAPVQGRETPYQGNYAGWQPVRSDMYQGYKQGGIPLYGYGSSVYGTYYNPNGSGQNPMPPYMGGPQPQPEKKRHKARAEHPTLFKIIDAVIFGLIAAITFFGCSYLYSYFFPKESEKYNVVQVARDSGADETDAVKTVETIETVITTGSDVSKIVEKVAPAIVQIDCMFNSTSYFGSYQTPGAGSGIVMKKTDKELLIATNNHVVEGAVSIKITFTDGTTASAEIKGTDSVADLAVVSVDLSTLDKAFVDSVVVAKLGSSDDVKVGQMAIAIGNAMGYGQSTTVGYISAKDREVTIDGTKMVLIQTDAAINPGNSGGALINVSGEVIGINSVKFASATIEGMGFAIPISRAQKILDELGNRESLTHEEKGYLGVHVQTVTAAISQAYNWPTGVYIAELDPGLAAETAGVEIGDIVIRVNGVTVSTTTDLKTAVSSYRAGTTVTVTVMRLVDNEFVEKDIDVVLGNEPEPEEEAQEQQNNGSEAADSNENAAEAPEDNADAPKASPKDGLPGNSDTQVQPYTSEELPDYFDPFKDFEELFPFGIR
ncbi:MAG: trypsin-like peptidase domain-containing protein [Lachnospiraceae bacterium]|nr:trypsin-like peptidase domain-containing protein [Lachnospiraceae bacterium]